MNSRAQALIAIARSYIGTKFAHQGRDRVTGMDCGGFAMVSARDAGLSDLEFLGYADFPTDGKFEELLQEHTIFLWERKFPFTFTGDELLPADLLSFDYGNGEGTRHLALVSQWLRNRYYVVEAQPKNGVTEHALAPPFIQRKMTIKAWRIPALV